MSKPLSDAREPRSLQRLVRPALVVHRYVVGIGFSDMGIAVCLAIHADIAATESNWIRCVGCWILCISVYVSAPRPNRQAEGRGSQTRAPAENGGQS
jgi:hypothetical protein